MKQLKVIVIGAGARGNTYSRHMNSMPEKYQIVGVAEPHAYKRAEFAKAYSIPEECCYESWEDILALPKFADVALITTNDDLHYEPTMRAIECGYDILLEKPVAQKAEECIAIANAAKKKGVRALVCHVLRYTPFYKTLKRIVDSGMIGEVMSVEQVEAIGNTHFAHSYVRGNWHDSGATTPIVLAKTCHDLDIIQWIVGKSCARVSSFGELTYFTEKNAPEGAPIRCSTGNCPERGRCPYDCFTTYVENPHNMWFKPYFRSAVATHENFTEEEYMKALDFTDYGLCVFHANNNVPDHQVVSMQFDGGATAQLTFNAFNHGGRYTRIYGTKGEVYAHEAAKEIPLFTLSDRKTQMIPVEYTEQSHKGGHGGGDYGIVYDLYDYLNGTYSGPDIAEIGISVENHLIGFAAEEARLEGSVVDVRSFEKAHTRDA